MNWPLFVIGIIAIEVPSIFIVYKILKMAAEIESLCAARPSGPPPLTAPQLPSVVLFDNDVLVIRVAPDVSQADCERIVEKLKAAGVKQAVIVFNDKVTGMSRIVRV